MPVLRVDGSPDLLSLANVLRDAHQLTGLAGDVPTQDPPLLRLLLAVLHRALDGPGSRADWAALWEADRLPDRPVTAYLDRWRHRFDLFSPTEPFFQVAGLHTAKGEFRTAALLVPMAASGNNVPLFDTSLDDGPPVFTPAQAARWLVHAHAFDTGSAKSAAVGDRQAKNGKSYAAEPALGRVGVVIPVGPTLRETLLLNLIATGEEGLIRRSPADLPVWERRPLTPDYVERRLTGPLDLYTFPARRIRLIPEQVAGQLAVRQVVLCAGDRVSPRDLATVEPHAGRVRSPTEEKTQPPPVYVPDRHRVGRQLWRGMAALLARAGASAAADAPRHRGPAVLAWLDRLRADDWLATDYPLGVLAYGVEYGDQSASVREVILDRLPFPVALLKPGSPAERAALDAVELADQVAAALRRLAGQVLRARGGDEASPTPAAAGERFYASLDAPYRRFLIVLADAPAQQLLAAAWRQALATTALELADELLDVPAPALFTSRSYQRQPMTAGVAERVFRARLADLLPDTSAGRPDRRESA